MAKKRRSKTSKKESNKNSFKASNYLGFIKDLFSNLILSQLVNFVKETVHHFQKAVYLTTRKVLESFLAVCIMIMGILMVVISLPFLLSYYLDLPASLFFILIGLILIIVALFSLEKISKSKYKE